jgi:hypothetical protein
VIFGVSFGRFRFVVRSVLSMGMRGDGVVRRLLVTASLMMFGCFMMMFSRVLVVLGCLLVVFACFFRHRSPLSESSLVSHFTDAQWQTLTSMKAPCE